MSSSDETRGLYATARAFGSLGRTFWVCNTVYFLDGAAYFGILNILTLFLGHSIGLSDRWTGYTVSYFTAAVTIGSAILGGVVDRLGVRRTMTLSIVAALLGRGLLAVAPDLPESALVSWAALTLMAVSAGTLTTAVYAGVKQVTTPATSAVGFSLLYAFMNGGSLVEAFASSFVRARYDVGGVFWMCAGITVTYALVHVVGFPRREGGPVPREGGALAMARAANRSWRDHALTRPRFLFFIFILLGVRTLFAHQWLTMPDYVTRAFPPEVGARFEWINGLNPLIIVFATPLAAALTRRVHVVTMMIIGTFVSASASFLLVLGPSLALLVAYEIIFALGESLWSSRFYEWVADAAPPDKVGVYMGVAQVPWFVAKFTTGLYSGAMLARFCPASGPQHTGTMWLVYGVIGLTSPLGLILARRWLAAGKLTDA